MSKRLKVVLVTLWCLFIAGIVGAVLLFFLIARGFVGYMPPIEDMQNPIDKYATQLISEDGEVLGSFALRGNNRLFLTYEDLSPQVVQALIATEDKRFAEHSGIDARGVVRAIVKRGLLRQKGAGGGSTITQQLAKQLYSPQANSLLERVLQKPIEWVIAVELERYYTKEEIITLYLNKFDFLYQAVGIESAAQTYFGKRPRELATEEAALLVGMCKNPSLYNPIRFPERAMERRNVVLRLMREQGFITSEECAALQASELGVRFSRQSHRAGLAPYFREYIRRIMTAAEPRKSDYRGWQQEQYERDREQWEHNPLYGWCHKNRKANGEPYNIYTDGLKVYTTINARMQEYAEDAVLQHLAGELQPRFDREKRGRKNAPFASSITQEERDKIMDRAIRLSDRYRYRKAEGLSEREILATFDEPVEMTIFDYAREGASGRYTTIMRDTILTPRDSILYHKRFLRASFMAMDNQSGAVRAYVGEQSFSAFQYDMVTQGRRQVGSVMKPFLYAMAMNEGYTPCTEIKHVQPHIPDENGRIWSPKNTGAKRVGEMVTINWGLQNSSNWTTAWLMSQMSPVAFVNLLHSFGVTGDLDPVVSICLGTPDISVEEMVTGFSTFAQAGIRAEPMYVTRIEDQYGNVVAEFTPMNRDVLPADATYKTLYMLRNVMNGGTGSRMRFRYNVTADMGGKTGTSQNQSDGWFVCFTPRITTASWVGGEDRSIHFDSIREGQGANTGLPITALFFQKVFKDPELQKRALELGIAPDLKFQIPEEYRDPCKGSADGFAPIIVEDLDEQGIDPLFE